MKKQITSVKNFVRKNQTKILIATNVATLVAAAGYKMARDQQMEFLKEKDLLDEFLTPEED